LPVFAAFFHGENNFKFNSLKMGIMTNHVYEYIIHLNNAWILIGKHVIHVFENVLKTNANNKKTFDCSKNQNNIQFKIY